LSNIVTDHLLEVLSARQDLDPALARELRERLHQATHATKTAAEAAVPDAARMTNEAFIAAARKGDSAVLAEMLATKASVPPAVIERAASLRSAKGLIALAWKANLSMQVAQALQIVLGRIPPDAVIHARPGGGFPMTVQEMRWQLEFLYRTGR
jgi:hypothetical protein